MATTRQLETELMGNAAPLVALLERERRITGREARLLEGPGFAGDVVAFRETEVKYMIVDPTDKYRQLFENHIGTRARVYANPPLLIPRMPVPSKTPPKPISWECEFPALDFYKVVTDADEARRRNKYYPHRPHALFKAPWVMGGKWAEFSAHAASRIKDAEIELNTPPATSTEIPTGLTPEVTTVDVSGTKTSISHTSSTSTPVTSITGPPEVKVINNGLCGAMTEELFLSVMGIPEINEQILIHMKYQSLSSLSQCSTKTFNIVSNFIQRWDLTASDFNFCEMTESEFEKHADEVDAEVAAAANKGGRRNVEEPKRLFRGKPLGMVVISPSRTDLDEVLDYKYRKLQRFHYTWHLRATALFLRATYNVGRHIENLMLQRMPFFNVEVLRAILPSLPNLENLAILHCQQIDFAATTRLLAIIDEYQKDYKHGLTLDFYPRYHQGPTYEGRRGGFGISWADSGVPLNTAIASRLGYEIIPAMLTCGQRQMLDADSSFIAWLERLPLPDFFVPRVLTIFLQLFDKKEDETKNMSSEEFLRFHCSLARAVFGNNGLVDDQDVLTWRRLPDRCGPVTCHACRAVMPNYFFTTSRNCDGCKLMSAVAQERDHYKKEKFDISNALLRKHPDKPNRRSDPFSTNVSHIARFDAHKWIDNMEGEYPLYRGAQVLSLQLDKRRYDDMAKGKNSEWEEPQFRNPFSRRADVLATADVHELHNHYRPAASWDRMFRKRADICGKSAAEIEQQMHEQWNTDKHPLQKKNIPKPTPAPAQDPWGTSDWTPAIGPAKWMSKTSRVPYW